MIADMLNIDEAIREARSPEALKGVTGQIVDAAFTVHSRLGPGLLESVYETCMEHELNRRDLWVQRQVALPVHYDTLTIDAAYRIDLLVENSVVLEVKAVESIQAVHKAQLRTYLKLSKNRVGLLINFNVALVKDGITRVVL